ncbi:MAG TPA: family 20 glycosylhydrolase, partial [Bacteroidales bacterium]
QLLPPDIENSAQVVTKSIIVPAIYIKDKPRFIYRGMHLDVGRHMFPIESIEKYIDLMASYKMNTFHWHLTEDQGWRIEIKKYPLLTQIGSIRKGTQVGKTDSIDEVPYGGFYTQDEAKSIVQYAADRFITVIPEIEMPGHSVAALKAYPQYSCTGGPFDVRTTWGVSDDIYCAGNDSTFAFLQDILTEVLDIFPSTYIHIGGDEAPKARWEECPKCQARITAEGLKDEMELQSYFIKRIEKFLVSRNRRLIGWDEILEGGLAPEATVMSWRGITGGTAAARQFHDVIMTPDSHCYFDHYQADPANEPLAIGGLTTLKTVYNYDPVPDELNETEAKHILGTQGNVWTEYISTPEYLEYMAYPRAIALAEVNWSGKESRNWNDFSRRMDNQYKRLDYKKVNYSKCALGIDISTSRVPITLTMKVKLESEIPGFIIHYTTDGSTPNANSAVYKDPFQLTVTTTVKAALFNAEEMKGNVSEGQVIVHKAFGKTIQINKPFSSKYPASGEFAMVDGLKGTGVLRNGCWQGYEGADMDITIDLSYVQPVNAISAGFLQSPGNWVFFPKSIIYLASIDGVTYDTLFTIDIPVSITAGFETKSFRCETPGKQFRYIRVEAKNIGNCPQGHKGAGYPAWLFADEIEVE